VKGAELATGSLALALIQGIGHACMQQTQEQSQETETIAVILAFLITTRTRQGNQRRGGLSIAKRASTLALALSDSISRPAHAIVHLTAQLDLVQPFHPIAIELVTMSIVCRRLANPTGECRRDPPTDDSMLILMIRCRGQHGS
jgi:hypothetical protein